ncbi:MAG TPA: type II secretion system major pseudopilin GspG [Tepidisphaeraceae bacterium]|jgi:general secretion pathway protein G|nr:type II secretion system major pseudopilin GspG [Tepidisphaeraceae bacterium]
MVSQVRRRRNNSAFTLIELLLVLVILAVLASIVVVNFGSVNRKKDEAKVKTDISNLDTALEMYKADMGDYPPSLDGLIAPPGNANTWHGPYVKRGMPQDPWGHAYIYVYPGQHLANGFDLSSQGDGHGGTTEGLDNWTAATPAH